MRQLIALAVLLLAACGGSSTPVQSTQPAPDPVLLDETFSHYVFGPVSVAANMSGPEMAQHEVAQCGDAGFGYKPSIVLYQHDPGVVQTFDFSTSWGIIPNPVYGGEKVSPFGTAGTSSEVFSESADGLTFRTIPYQDYGTVAHGWILSSAQTFTHDKPLMVSARLDVSIDEAWRQAHPADAFTALAFGSGEDDFREMAFRPDSASTFQLEAWIDCSVIVLQRGIPASATHTVAIGSLVDHWAYYLDGTLLFTDYVLPPSNPRFKPAHVALVLDGSTAGVLHDIKVSTAP